MLIGQAAPAFAAFFGATPPRHRDAELRALLVGAAWASGHERAGMSERA
jgi:hypothetical protein